MNLMDQALFWTLKWIVIITLAIVGIALIPAVIFGSIYEVAGPLGVIVFLALIGWLVWTFIRKRLPQRKREV
jgi:hypothetical protein